MKLSIARLAVVALAAAPVGSAFTATTRPSFVRHGLAMAKMDAGKQQQQQDQDTEAFFEDQMNADAFADSMEEQRESLDKYEAASKEFRVGSEIKSLEQDYVNEELVLEETEAVVVDKQKKSGLPNMKDIKMPNINVKMPDMTSRLQNLKDSVDEEQVKEFMGKAGYFSKSAFAFGKNALEESAELAKQVKASMSTTHVGKDKDTTYEDAWNKVGKAGMGVWSLMKDFGGFVQEHVDVDGLKASAESKLSDLKAKKTVLPIVKDDKEEEM